MTEIESAPSAESMASVSGLSRLAAQRDEADRRAGLDHPDLFLNRETSWVRFNERVLELAEDPSVPLLERVRFASIYTSNLDEFFMIRVAGLHERVAAGLDEPMADGETPAATIETIHGMVCAHAARLARLLDEQLLPALAEHGVRIVSCAQLDDGQTRELRDRFRRQILPVLTPLAVGPGRPFPYISNLSLSLAVRVRDPDSGHTAFTRVKVPKELLPRFVPLDGGATLVPLEDAIAGHAETLFPGMELTEHGFFRVTRDADFEVSDEADDLLQAVEAELRRRRFGEVVRLEVDAAMPADLRDELREALRVDPVQVYEVEGLMDLEDLSEIADLPGRADLRYPAWTPVTPPRLGAEHASDGTDVLATIRQRDVLVHHPYDSFGSSVERFVEQAVADPDVLAIKLTIYRTSDDTPLIPALIRATERGKQAVCLVELKARFDEQANIGWARALEEAGVHVVYGLPALKTHAKCILVVRREGGGVTHYVHVGTGNYHPKTARLYTDFGLFTCDERIGLDVGDMFNFLTGFARPRRLREVLLAPTRLRDGVLEEIEATIAAAERGEHARIALKLNALVDKRCILALYRAAQAGVKVELNVRGICCLKPGLPGVSEGIRVVSIVGRFLEHSRILAFERGDERSVWIGSADLMPRNLDTRVELAAPVHDEAARAQLLDVLERCFADDVNAWDLRPDGTWERRSQRGTEPRSVQGELMALHARAASDIPPDQDHTITTTEVTNA